MPTKADNISPRLGFALWPAPLPQTSIRGGFGIFNDNVGRQNAIAPGYNQSTAMPITTNNYLSPATTLSNPFPNGLIQPAGNSRRVSRRSWVVPSASFRHWCAMTTTTLSAGIWTSSRPCRAIPLVEVDYVGSHLARLPVSSRTSRLCAGVTYLNVGQAQAWRRLSTSSVLSVTNPFAGLSPWDNSQHRHDCPVAATSALPPVHRGHPVAGSDWQHGI